MELVIKIPEDVYTRLFDNGIQDNEIAVDDVCEMARALRLGTLLPKGHGRIVDIGLYEGKVIASRTYCGVNKLIEVAELDTLIEADKENEK